MRKGPQVGQFVISLDLELMWGMFDKTSIAEYGKNIKHVHSVVPKLLEVFTKYDIHATWAAVGMLMCRDEKEWQDLVSKVSPQPEYERHELSSYTQGQKTNLSKNHDYYFAPQLIQNIINTPNQELASHTLSHFYCLETQTNPHDAFVADCNMFTAITAQWKKSIHSIVFPRNQWTQDALATCVENGIITYRGTENHPFYRARNDRQQTNPLIRILRLLDNYFNLSGYHTYTVDNDSAIVNIPSSRFLRPYSRHFWFVEPLRKRRIKKAMLDAAKHGRVFHLWWHPHNFGNYSKQNFSFLIDILEYYQNLNKKYGMESVTMYEVATQNDEQTA